MTRANLLAVFLILLLLALILASAVIESDISYTRNERATVAALLTENAGTLGVILTEGR